MEPLDINELRDVLLAEMERRRIGDAPGDYADRPDGEPALYGVVGAINCLGAFGLVPSDAAVRNAWAERVMSYRNDAGAFREDAGAGHGLCMALSAFNLLGVPVPEHVAPLAPRDVEMLPAWIDALDWKSTHKELWGRATPLLAGGMPKEWCDVFCGEIDKRLSPERPAETWCEADAPSWRVISCVYHVASAFDAGRLPYPRPRMLIERILGLAWHDESDETPRTVCTDGDWAWLLLRLTDALPEYAADAVVAVRAVSARRINAWREGRAGLAEMSTHELYCYLWSTAVFQSCVRDHYVGGFLRDTLNDPAVFRLSSRRVF